MRAVDADGIERDAIFGELPAELTPHVEQLWLQPPVITAAASGIHAETVYQLATDLGNQLTSLQRFRPAVLNAAKALAEKLTAVTPTVAGPHLAPRLSRCAVDVRGAAHGLERGVCAR